MLGTLIVICITILLLSSIIGGVIIEKSKDKCKHLYDTPKDGFQICKNCGCVHYVECNHSWDRIDSATIGSLMVNVLQCKKCGDIMYRSFDSLKLLR